MDAYQAHERYSACRQQKALTIGWLPAGTLLGPSNEGNIIRSPERPPSARWKALSSARSIWPKNGSLPRYGDRAMVLLCNAGTGESSNRNRVQWTAEYALLVPLYVDETAETPCLYIERLYDRVVPGYIWKVP
jgi:hypothetical protein